MQKKRNETEKTVVLVHESKTVKEYKIKPQALDLRKLLADVRELFSGLDGFVYVMPNARGAMSLLTLDKVGSVVRVRTTDTKKITLQER